MRNVWKSLEKLKRVILLHCYCVGPSGDGVVNVRIATWSLFYFLISYFWRFFFLFFFFEFVVLIRFHLEETISIIEVLDINNCTIHYFHWFARIKHHDCIVIFPPPLPPKKNIWVLCLRSSLRPHVKIIIANHL